MVELAPEFNKTNITQSKDVILSNVFIDEKGHAVNELDNAELLNYEQKSDSLDSEIEKENKRKKISVKVELKTELELFDEEFELWKKQDRLHLKHKKWSLSGFGATLNEAIESLKENGEILHEAYSDINTSELSPDAIDLVSFLTFTFGNE